MNLPIFQDAMVLTNSQLATFRTCQRKEWFKSVAGVVPENQSTALRFGTNIHYGIEVRGKGRSIDDALAAVERIYLDMPSNVTEREWQIEREVVMTLLRGYFWFWERPEVPEHLRTIMFVACEEQFMLKIPRSKYRFAGKIDGIAILGDGRKAVVETKTSSEDISPDSDYVARLRIDNQISGYVVGARSLKYAVETVLYNIIKKPTIRPLSATPPEARKYTKEGKLYASQREVDETPAEFRDRLSADIEADPTKYYARYEIPRLDGDIREWWLELGQTAKQIAAARKDNHKVRNTAACLTYGRCPYLNVCHSGIDSDGSVPSGFRRVERIHEELNQ